MRRSTIAKCSGVFILLFTLGSGALGADATNFLWIENDGAVQFGSLSAFVIGLQQGQVSSPKLQTLISAIDSQSERSNEKTVDLLKTHLAEHGIQRPLIGPLGSEDAMKKASAEFDSAIAAANLKSKGVIQGRLYRMRPMDGTETTSEQHNVIYLIPADPALLGEFRVRDASGADAIFRKKLIELLQQQIAEGKTEFQKTIDIVTADGLPAFSDPGWKISQELKKQLRMDGAYDEVNDYEAIKVYISSGSHKNLVHSAKPGSNGEFKFVDLIPGDYLLYYRQDLTTFLYWISLSPEETKDVDVFRPFSTRSFTVEG